MYLCFMYLYFMYQERLCLQPVQQRLAIGRGKDVGHGVLAGETATATSDRQQMQIVIAEHRHCGITQGTDFAQARQRVRPPVDQVACQP